MAKITGGEVEYGRTVKTGDFENKKATVKLSFGVDEGEDHVKILDAAAAEAQARVYTMLGLKQPIAASAAKVAAVAEPKVEPKPEPKAKPKTKADLEAEQNAKLKATPAAATAKAELAGEDMGEAFDEDATEAQPDVTDEMLSAAMNRKASELKAVHGGAAPKLIKELINTFVEPPKKSHDIPQNLRHPFLAKLKELK